MYIQPNSLYFIKKMFYLIFTFFINHIYYPLFLKYKRGKTILKEIAIKSKSS